MCHGQRYWPHRGFFFALGAYNPVYYLLWHVVQDSTCSGRQHAGWNSMRWVWLRWLRSGWMRWLLPRETRRHGDEERGRRGQGDTTTRRHGDKGTRRAAELEQTYGNCIGGPAARHADYHPAASTIVDAGGLGGHGRRCGRTALGGETLAQVRQHGGLVALTFAELWLGRTRCPSPWRRPPPRQVCATRQPPCSPRRKANRPPVATVS